VDEKLILGIVDKKWDADNADNTQIKTDFNFLYYLKIRFYLCFALAIGVICIPIV
jgi:hypothetical protein